jgi:two-component system, NarL family, sensor histidine kinase DevS
VATPALSLDESRLARLIEVGRSLLSELDLDVVLDRLLETARDLTGARYAALGILGEDRRGLEQFVTRGIDEATHRAIGDLPRGRGILGVLIDDPRPLRLGEVGEDPRSYGFPPGHPPMQTFLGVPILIRGRAWGNLYLTEKAGREPFSAADEQSVVVLADWAAIAIENARLYRAAAARRDELERAVRALEATTAIARAVGDETGLAGVLELVVGRGRALVEARDVLILLRDGDELAVRASAGAASPGAGARLPIAGTTAGDVLAARGAVRVDDVERDLRPASSAFGVPDAATALLVPLVYRGSALGVLVAFDRVAGEPRFSRDQEDLLEAFAAQAATAVATARSAAAERMRRSLEAAESERRRWARELHDETLQGLGGIRVLLSSASRVDEPAAMRQAIDQAVEQVTREVESLRALIAELRPAALDHLGLTPALRTLLLRTGERNGLQISAELELELEDERLAPELETTVYRIVQEALTNVVKHARAERVRVTVGIEDGAVAVSVVDDGRGLAPGALEGSAGFGLLGMRERVELVGGELAIGPSAGGGTRVAARVPIA